MRQTPASIKPFSNGSRPIKHHVKIQLQKSVKLEWHPRKHKMNLAQMTTSFGTFWRPLKTSASSKSQRPQWLRRLHHVANLAGVLSNYAAQATDVAALRTHSKVLEAAITPGPASHPTLYLMAAGSTRFQSMAQISFT
ncbi:hypothetical protein HO173_012177 [Letharia columbiana]|uniref:Uncharacterized protein n=1 Tax=Letharia columbiana TaxID=112416 RepID=A0A8H6FH00_9LECA|nr:uncharacterized protein HO173_012177 [Letharia columbiana]KAF6227538.1 hypothetical protein HO173_012177 [Letharia columbiana]